MSGTIQVDQSDKADSTEQRGVRLTTVLIWGAILAFVALMGWGLLNSTAPRPEAGEAAPAFTMEFFNGYEWDSRPVVDLGDLQGNVVVVNFWASWCVECRTEADLLEQAWQKYKDQGVVFVGIAYADVEPNSLDYMREFGVTYPHAPDLGTSISADYEITGVPETFIIDKNGEIADVVIGPVRPGYMDAVIDQLLAQ
ncbi:MAG: TlpA family protein disulfide reductase [Anaerolineales bacterium]|nr:TlpA family protein disulfide reductase [Anaerolineales bacterium]